MLIEFLAFAIMVPLALLAWRGVAAALKSRNPNSSIATAIDSFVGS